MQKFTLTDVESGEEITLAKERRGKKNLFTLIANVYENLVFDGSLCVFFFSRSLLVLINVFAIRLLSI